MTIALLTIALAALAWLANRSWPNVSPSPPVIAAAATFWLTLGLPLALTSESVAHLASGAGGNAEELSYARAVILFGGCFIVAGLGLAPAPASPPRTAFRLPRPAAKLLLGMAVAALLLRGATGASVSRYAGEAAAGGGYAYYLPHFTATTCLLLLAVEQDAKKSFRLTATTILAACLALFWLSGVRFTLMAYLISIFALLIARKRSEIRFSPTMVVAAAFATVLILGYIGNVRAASVTDVSYVDRAVISTEVLWPSALAVERVEKLGLLGGATYLDLFIQPVPRELWPHKPAPAIQQFLVAFTDGDAGRAIAAPVEAYINFGLAGMSAFLVLISFVAGGYLRWMLATFPGRAGHMLYALSCVVLLNGYFRGYLVATIYQYAAMVGPVIFIHFLTRGRRRHSTRTGRPTHVSASAAATGIATTGQDPWRSVTART